MDAIKYKILVTVDGIHHFMDHEIEEVHIPERNITFNEKGYCFRSENRNPGSESEPIEVADSLVSTLEVFLETERITKSSISRYFEKIVKCSKCNTDIGPTLKRLFIDSEKKQQVCPRCWERECEERFSRGNKT